MGGNSSKTMTTNLNENLTVISQQPFAFTLINLLKDKGVITTGITIPFIIGAYKIAKHDSIEVNLKFIQEVFADIVATAKDTKFFICTCNHINQHVITILTQEDTDVTGHYSTYQHIKNSDGVPVLYFEENFDIAYPSLDKISQFYWLKYEHILKEQVYSYRSTENKWIKFSDTELGCIISAFSSCEEAKEIIRPRISKNVARIYYFWCVLNILLLLRGLAYGDDFDRQIKRWFPFEGDLDCYDISEFILYCAIIPLVLRWIYKGWKKVECKYYKD